MLDPARLTEKHRFYFDLLPQLAEWGYNVLWWHFSDDEGFAQKLRSHPELASPFAFSRAEARRLAEKARALGIDVVPEVESLGHSLSITGLPRYAHLFDGNPFGHNAMCPSQPDTLKLMKEIIPEVAELFGGEYLHAGLDEANLGDCPRCRRRGKGKPRWWVFSRHVLAIHDIVRSSGRRMIMWADSVEKHPELLDVLPKDIVLAHWHYTDVPEHLVRPSVRAGFEVVCVPALTGTAVQPDEAAFRNNDLMASLAARLEGRGGLGMVACWWEPFRCLRDAYPAAIAYAGEIMRKKGPQDRVAFFRRFARAHFGLEGASAARVLQGLHEVMLDRREFKTLTFDCATDVHETLNLAASPGFPERAGRAEEIAAALRAARDGAKRHRGQLGASLIAAEVVAACLKSGLGLLEASKVYARAAHLSEVGASRADVARQLDAARRRAAAVLPAVDRVTKAVSREWDRTRHPKDAKKDNSSPRIRQRGMRALLPSLMRWRDFSREMLDSFGRATKAYRLGGPFPGGP
jgi:hypothetical protein